MAKKVEHWTMTSKVLSSDRRDEKIPHLTTCSLEYVDLKEIHELECQKHITQEEMQNSKATMVKNIAETAGECPSVVAMCT